MGKARLTVCSMTLNSASTLPLWMSAVRQYADEVVVAVDSSSSDGTAELARDLADSVVVFEHPRFAEEIFDGLFRRATGDWVLHLDDDEVMSTSFIAARDSLLADRDLTHYFMERRWAVPTDEAGGAWIRQFPWFPDPCLRLFRNIGSLFVRPPRLHMPLSVLGGGARVLAAGEACLYHADLLWRDRATRERKALVTYGGVLSHFYLFEEHVETASLRPVHDPTVSGWLAETARRRSRPAGEAPAPDGPVALIEDMTATARRSAPPGRRSIPRVIAHDTPNHMSPHEGCLVTVRVQNTGDGAWPAGGLRGGTRLTYHWLLGTGEVVVENAWPAPLGRTLAPGEAIDVVTGVWAPENPGHYVLAWDVVVDGLFQGLEDGGAEGGRIRVQVGEPDVAAPTAAEPAAGPGLGRRFARALVARFPRLRPVAAWLRDRVRVDFARRKS